MARSAHINHVLNQAIQLAERLEADDSPTRADLDDADRQLMAGASKLSSACHYKARLKERGLSRRAKRRIRFSMYRRINQLEGIAIDCMCEVGYINQLIATKLGVADIALQCARSQTCSTERRIAEQLIVYLERKREHLKALQEIATDQLNAALRQLNSARAMKNYPGMHQKMQWKPRQLPRVQMLGCVNQSRCSRNSPWRKEVAACITED